MGTIKCRPDDGARWKAMGYPKLSEFILSGACMYFAGADPLIEEDFLGVCVLYRRTTGLRHKLALKEQ